MRGRSWQELVDIVSRSHCSRQICPHPQGLLVWSKHYREIETFERTFEHARSPLNTHEKFLEDR